MGCGPHATSLSLVCLTTTRECGRSGRLQMGVGEVGCTDMLQPAISVSIYKRHRELDCANDAVASCSIHVPGLHMLLCTDEVNHGHMPGCDCHTITLSVVLQTTSVLLRHTKAPAYMTCRRSKRRQSLQRPRRGPRARRRRRAAARPSSRLWSGGASCCWALQRRRGRRRLRCGPCHADVFE